MHFVHTTEKHFLSLESSSLTLTQGNFYQSACKRKPGSRVYKLLLLKNEIVTEFPKVQEFFLFVFFSHLIASQLDLLCNLNLKGQYNFFKSNLLSM